VAEEKITPESLTLSISPQVFWIFEAPLDIECNNFIGERRCGEMNKWLCTLSHFELVSGSASSTQPDIRLAAPPLVHADGPG
jgi:hypothetical protein